MLCLLNILDATESHGIKRITIASSVTAYGGLNGPFFESTPLPVASKNSTNAYKKAEEILGLHFGAATALEVVAARIAYVYGPLYHSMTNAPSRFVHAAARGMNEKQETAPFAGNYHDYTYVKDVAEGLWLLQTAPKLSAHVYNLGSGRASSNSMIADAVRKAAPAAKLLMREGKQDGAGGPNDYLDLALIGKDTGYAPKYDVEKACFEYVGWVKQNEY
jgi:UDP-glucose 4-epimerase